MLVQTARSQAAASEIAEFSEFLQSVGEGTSDLSLGEHHIRIPDDLILQPEGVEKFPNFDLFRVPPEENSPGANNTLEIDRFLDEIYGRISHCMPEDQYFTERAILAARNEDVRRVNDLMASRLQGEPWKYLSVELVHGDFTVSFIEMEVLNSLNPSGILPHKLILKVGAPIMMIRNLNRNEGLCNGIRFRIVALHGHCIQASIMTGLMTGLRKGQVVFIPRIVFISDDDDNEFAFQLRRKQFPVIPAFAMTINKSQGQSIHNLGLCLPTLVFAHGQLYVALSRVTSRDTIKILLDNGDEDDDGGRGFLRKKHSSSRDF